MSNLKVVEIGEESLKFDDGTVLKSHHDSDCCEYHWLAMDELSMSDFEGLEFDILSDDFFERIQGYGIGLKPINGFPVRIAGHGSNNGYYSDQLEIQVWKDGKKLKTFDITECQNEIESY